jgi:hypothetical protein
VEQQHFVLIMFEVLQGREQVVRLGDVFEHVTENDDQGPLADLVGHLVDYFRNGRFLGGLGGVEQALQQQEKLVNVRRSGAGRRVGFDLVGKVQMLMASFCFWSRYARQAAAMMLNVILPLVSAG